MRYLILKVLAIFTLCVISILAYSATFLPPPWPSYSFPQNRGEESGDTFNGRYKDQRLFDAWYSWDERERAIALTEIVTNGLGEVSTNLLDYSRDWDYWKVRHDHEFLVEWKLWILRNASNFVDYSYADDYGGYELSFDEYFRSNYTVSVGAITTICGVVATYTTNYTLQFPRFSVASLIGHSAISYGEHIGKYPPTNYFDNGGENTPWRELAGDTSLKDRPWSSLYDLPYTAVEKSGGNYKNGDYGWKYFDAVMTNLIYTQGDIAYCKNYCSCTSDIGQYVTINGEFVMVSGCSNTLPSAWIQINESVITSPTDTWVSARCLRIASGWVLSGVDCDGNEASKSESWDFDWDSTMPESADYWLDVLRKWASEDRRHLACLYGIKDADFSWYAAKGQEYECEVRVIEIGTKTNFTETKSAYLSSIEVVGPTNMRSEVNVYFAANTGSTPATKLISSHEPGCVISGYSMADCEICGSIYVYTNYAEPIYTPGIVIVTNLVSVFETNAPVQPSKSLKFYQSKLSTNGLVCFPFMDEPNWTPPGDTYPRASGWEITGAAVLKKWNIDRGFKYY